MSTKIVTIIPAEPGLRTVYFFVEDLTCEACEPIVAWRVETEEIRPGAYQSTPYPITADGEPGDNAVGMQHANGVVTEWDGGTFDSLVDFSDYRKAEAAR